MKLEKFDYQIGNKKTKREFIVLGGLCIALVVTVVLYRTFAKFSSSASFNIISSRVGTLNRVEVVKVDISKEGEENEVYAILYDDKTLSIDGTGQMKDFSGTDLIGEVLEAYITDKVTFTAEEQAFMSDINNVKAVKSIIDLAGRSAFTTIDETDFNNKISGLFIDENEEPITASIEMANAIKDKVIAAGFDVDNIEFGGNITNIGDYAFNLKGAINANDSIRYDLYTYDTVDYYHEPNVWESFDTVTLKANITNVGNPETTGSAVSDIYANNVIIEPGVTTIPNDLFAWYGDKLQTTSSVPKTNQKVSIPDSVTKIGRNAFYQYKGTELAIPSTINEINEYAFASYNGDILDILNQDANISEGAFRDFTGRINLNTSGNICPINITFAPNAHIYVNDVECSFE